MAQHLAELIESRADSECQAVCCLNAALSYAALSKRSRQLANVLIDQGVERGDRVGIYMNKRIEAAVAMYGIMRAGAAYVPIDPAAPPGRFAAIVNDCGMKHVVSAPDKVRSFRVLSGYRTEVECLIGVDAADGTSYRCISWTDVENAAAHTPSVAPRPSDLAYIIYTSGSTGTPKGIMHTHASSLSFATWAAAEYGLRDDDRLSNHAPLHFDLSIFDYFAGAVAGAATVIVPEEFTRMPASYSQLLSDQRVSVLFTVPFALIQLLLRGALNARDLSRLRWIIFGGEPFPTKHLRALMRQLTHVRFDNMYGPAEINGCTHFTIDRPDRIGDQVPIGPISEIARALVVDNDDLSVPQGEPGELLVHTPTMMQGYWNRPDLNARAFFEDPETLAVYYRTGDLVRLMSTGDFEFLGRKDRQIKVRGYRVELDEIEAALTTHEQVEEAAAFAVPDGNGSSIVKAAVTITGDSVLEPSEITSLLKASLPWYAIPSEVSIREWFPRTTTGKIDRRLLREEVLEAGA